LRNLTAVDTVADAAGVLLLLLLLTYVVAGMAVTAIDTPGLHASADAQSANRSLLKSIKAAWKKHKPNFLIYVDRCVWVYASGGVAGGEGGGGVWVSGAKHCRCPPWLSTNGACQCDVAYLL
jgi:hypothetical protein